MKKRLALTALSIFLLASLSYGGHTISGGGRTECPGQCEVTGVCLTCGQSCEYSQTRMVSEYPKDQVETPTSTDAGSDYFGPGALVAILLALAWARLRS